MVAKGIEFLRPELTIGSQPGVELGKRGRVEAIKAPRPIDTDANQACLAQGLEVLGNIWLRQGEAVHQGTGGLLTLPQQGENVASNGIGDGAKG